MRTQYLNYVRAKNLVGLIYEISHKIITTNIRSDSPVELESIRIGNEKHLALYLGKTTAMNESHDHEPVRVGILLDGQLVINSRVTNLDEEISNDRSKLDAEDLMSICCLMLVFARDCGVQRYKLREFVGRYASITKRLHARFVDELPPNFLS